MSTWPAFAVRSGWSARGCSALIAQGYRKSGVVVNVGYRRKLDERFSLTFAGQNILDTSR